MAKENVLRENPVTEALRKLKDEEVELLAKLKPVQEAIGALEKIVDKTVRKTKTSGGKDNGGDNTILEESMHDVNVN